MGSPVGPPDGEGNGLLHVAVAQGYPLPMVRFLLDEFPPEHPSLGLNAPNRAGSAPLHLLAAQQALPLLRLLAHSKALSALDPSVQDLQGNTALHLAVGSQWAEGIPALFDLGAGESILLPNVDCLSPLEIARRNRDKEIVGMLEREKFRLKIIPFVEPLYQVIELQQEKIKELEEKIAILSDKLTNHL
eukprot:TRINITY_DN19371_c0_g1_i2.p1 TRINITY_DN19371_c0_g1~~TRINITY_DN19371_c0_g1_i2.p1  ORF type:complete len:201 (+),score=39.05 TRINITY_DN19371_c0_g1_i2:38-604(+)